MLVVTTQRGSHQNLEKKFAGQLSEILPASSPNDIVSENSGNPGGNGIPFDNTTNNPSMQTKTDQGSQNGSLLNDNNV